MNRDPKMKKRRGKYVCALDGCEEPLNEIAVKNQDPFHQTDCARAYYGVPLVKPQRGEFVASSS